VLSIPDEPDRTAMAEDVHPQYGTCEQCGRVGYEVEVACSTCYITLCPFCEHDCEEASC
jgi:hypothetical protein